MPDNRSQRRENTQSQRHSNRQTDEKPPVREREREAVDEHACMRGKEEERRVISVISSFCDPTYG